MSSPRRSAWTDHPWSADDLPGGAAVAQYDIGATSEDPRFDIIRGWGATAEGVSPIQRPGTCATDDRYKLVTLGEHERLYDLATDPLEVAPIVTRRRPAGRRRRDCGRH